MEKQKVILPVLIQSIQQSQFLFPGVFILCFLILLSAFLYRLCVLFLVFVYFLLRKGIFSLRNQGFPRFVHLRQKETHLL